MSYAIIRNTKYKRENLKGIFRHKERRNKNYSNENIDKEKSYLNYSLKSPQYSYEKEFEMEWKYKEQTCWFAPYYFICFSANSQAETTKPLKEYSFLTSPLLALSTI